MLKGLDSYTPGNVVAGATDISGTPGNGTSNTPVTRCAIAALASAVTITSSICTPSSKVFATINQAAADATLTSIARVKTNAGNFVITGNAAATAAVVIDCLLLN